MLAPYSEKVRALSVVIGKLEGALKKDGVGAGSLGNFVTDGMRAQAKAKLGKPITLAIINAGGLRKNEISAGELRASDIFELFPFENALVALEVTGAQLVKLLQSPLATHSQARAFNSSGTIRIAPSLSAANSSTRMDANRRSIRRRSIPSSRSIT